MKTISNFFRKLKNDESAQGMTEYILLAVVVVGLVVMFKQKITDLIKGKIDQLGNDINQVN